MFQRACVTPDMCPMAHSSPHGALLGNERSHVWTLELQKCVDALARVSACACLCVHVACTRSGSNQLLSGHIATYIMAIRLNPLSLDMSLFQHMLFGTPWNLHVQKWYCFLELVVGRRASGCSIGGRRTEMQGSHIRLQSYFQIGFLKFFQLQYLEEFSLLTLLMKLSYFTYISHFINISRINMKSSYFII